MRKKKGRSKFTSVADWFSQAQLLPLSGRQDETSQEKCVGRGRCPVPTEKKIPNSDLTRHHLLFMCSCPESCSCVTTARLP
jgi:hypothetical protein